MRGREGQGEGQRIEEEGRAGDIWRRCLMREFDLDHLRMSLDRC